MSHPATTEVVWLISLCFAFSWLIIPFQVCLFLSITFEILWSLFYLNFWINFRALSFSNLFHSGLFRVLWFTLVPLKSFLIHSQIDLITKMFFTFRLFRQTFKLNQILQITWIWSVRFYRFEAVTHPGIIYAATASQMSFVSLWLSNTPPSSNHSYPPTRAINH